MGGEKSLENVDAEVSAGTGECCFDGRHLFIGTRVDTGVEKRYLLT